MLFLILQPVTVETDQLVVVVSSAMAERIGVLDQVQHHPKRPVSYFLCIVGVEDLVVIYAQSGEHETDLDVVGGDNFIRRDRFVSQCDVVQELEL